MIRNLSQKQLDVMKILWDAGTPLVASDIVKAESSMNINTVQASLRVLLKENLVEIADIVYSGTVLSRSYRPLISRDVYFNAEYKNIIGNSSTSCLLIKQLSVTSNSYICSGHARIGTDAKEHKVFASES